MSQPEPTATTWCCGVCDTWNETSTVNCVVCEAVMRDEWLQQPPLPAADRPLGSRLGVGVRQPPTPSPAGPSLKLSVPLDIGNAPPQPSTGGPPPSIAALLANASEQNEQPTPLHPVVVIAAVAVAVLSLIVLAVIALG